MHTDVLYVEELSSPRTMALFVALALLFLALAAWRVTTQGVEVVACVFAAFCIFFVFYALNYRTLFIRLTDEVLSLRFGLFIWAIPVENIARCARDDVSLWRIGGAGIHFSPLRGRYRAMFNFLQHPRVVLVLKTRMGPVGAVAFSTRQPEEVMRCIADARERRA
jgi:hypothetical protein